MFSHTRKLLASSNVFISQTLDNDKHEIYNVFFSSKFILHVFFFIYLVREVLVHFFFIVRSHRVRAVDRHCRKMRQKYKCGARFFHLAKVHGDNFLSSNLNSTY